MKNLALLILTLALAACGESKSSEPSPYVYTDKRGTEHQCTVIDDTQPCGLVLACESGGGFHQCVSSSL